MTGRTEKTLKIIRWKFINLSAAFKCFIYLISESGIDSILSHNIYRLKIQLVRIGVELGLDSFDAMVSKQLSLCWGAAWFSGSRFRREQEEAIELII